MRACECILDEMKTERATENSCVCMFAWTEEDGLVGVNVLLPQVFGFRIFLVQYHSEIGYAYVVIIRTFH